MCVYVLCLCLYHISLRLHRASDAASRSPHFRSPQNAQPSPTLGCAMLISACYPLLLRRWRYASLPELPAKTTVHFFILSSPMRYGVDRPRPWTTTKNIIRLAVVAPPPFHTRVLLAVPSLGSPVRPGFTAEHRNRLMMLFATKFKFTCRNFLFKCYM